MGLKSLKHTFEQPGVSVLHTKFPCSSPNTLSAIETTIKNRSTKKNVDQNLPTKVECWATCSTSFSIICHAMIAFFCVFFPLKKVWLTYLFASYINFLPFPVCNSFSGLSKNPCPPIEAKKISQHKCEIEGSVQKLVEDLFKVFLKS